MKKQISEQAIVAKLIRAKLKEWKIPCKVIARSYVGGTSVEVYLTNQPKEIYEKVRSFTSQFEYSDNETPRTGKVNFLFVDNAISPEKKQEVYNNIRSKWAGGDKLPEKYEEARNIHFQGCYISQFVWREFSQI